MKILKTDSTDYGTLLIRIALGVSILPHGLQKTLGWFGGYGFSGTLEGISKMGVPSFLVILVILAESLGAFGLIFGVLSRFTAAGIMLTMLGAMFIGKHIEHGFFINWFGNQAGHGIEYHLVIIAMGLFVTLKGGGAIAFDTLLNRWLTKKD